MTAVVPPAVEVTALVEMADMATVIAAPVVITTPTEEAPLDTDPPLAILWRNTRRLLHHVEDMMIRTDAITPLPPLPKLMRMVDLTIALLEISLLLVRGHTLPGMAVMCGTMTVVDATGKFSLLPIPPKQSCFAF